MKRFLNYFASMAFIASLFVVASCSTEDEPGVDGPSILIDGTETTVDVGEEVTFDVNVTAPAGFNRLIVERTIGDGTTETIEDIARPAGTTTTTYDYTFTYTPTAAVAGETVVIDFTVVDDANNENTSTYTIYVNDQEVVPFTTILLAAPADDGSSESFFSTSNGEIYSSDEVTGTSESISPLIDFGYFYGEDWQATLASPAQFPTGVGQSGWDARNSTRLKITDLDESSFNESNATMINAAFEEAEFGDNQEQARNLQVGDVVAFETDPTKDGGSRRGLARVVAIDPGISPDTDFIELDIRVIQ